MNYAKQNGRHSIECTHTYERPGNYEVLVKVVDIFVNDTNKFINLEV